MELRGPGYINPYMKLEPGDQFLFRKRKGLLAHIFARKEPDIWLTVESVGRWSPYLGANGFLVVETGLVYFYYEMKAIRRHPNKQLVPHKDGELPDV